MFPPDFNAMSSAQLEERRQLLQEDEILVEMHTIVREQERRIKAGTLRKMLEGMPPAERQKFLDDAKKA